MKLFLSNSVAQALSSGDPKVISLEIDSENVVVCWRSAYCHMRLHYTFDDREKKDRLPAARERLKEVLECLV